MKNIRKIAAIFLTLVMCMALAVISFSPSKTGKSYKRGADVGLTGETVATSAAQKVSDSILPCDHTPGTIVNTKWVTPADFNAAKYCYYEEEIITTICQECKTIYDYKSGEERCRTHSKEYVTDEPIDDRDFYCSLCDYVSWEPVSDETE